jgi:tRNA 2-selenouridine synthase
VLGNIPCQPQPTQKAFETSIWDRLRRFDPSLPVFVESESKKVGDLRVPGALMDRMRASPCIAMQVARSDRVKLLIEDYQHFACNAPALNAQLEFLTPLHGKEKIERWQQMSNGGQMPQLVDELLVDHYDPAYLRSINKNFVQYDKAEVVELADISPEAFLAAARQLHRE